MKKNPRQVAEKKIEAFLAVVKRAHDPHVEATAKLTRSRDIEITIEICDSRSEEDKAADGYSDFPDLAKLKIRLAPLFAKRYPARKKTTNSRGKK
jgi:hypothetical protein